MDITLERILSLIPKNENGKFQHGAKGAFAASIGLANGNVISDWIAGRSQSYRNYLYEISAKYDVSVEWLKGETDEKKPANLSDSGSDMADIIRSLEKASPERLRAIRDFLITFEP